MCIILTDKFNIDTKKLQYHKYITTSLDGAYSL